MKQKILSLLYIFALFSVCFLNLHAEEQPKEGNIGEKISLEDIGLSPSTEDDFISNTRNVLRAIHELAKGQEGAEESNLNDFIAYRDQLKKAALCLRFNNPNLPLTEKFILLINEARMWSPIHETGVSSSSKTKFTDDEIKILKRTIDDYRNNYGQVIDQLSDCSELND